MCRISDDFSVGTELRVDIGRTAAAQARIADRSDAVVCVSPTLVDRWHSDDRPTVMIANGADVGRFRNAAEQPRPSTIELPDPIVGYVGQLSTRIDTELLDEVADRGHSLLLVGRIREDLDPTRVQRLLERPNVQWLEPVPYDEVPAHVGAMAVGLLPYTSSEFNLASFPLKVFDYLAAGVATVSTDLPAIRWLRSDAVVVADGRRAFGSAVDTAVDTAEDPTGRAERIALAEQHSWSRRAAQYLALLDQLDDAAGTTQSSSR